ncbi:MAG: hypothetical protein LBL52_01415 [Rickettsiales bacterium]|jgi:hypothetical protein|nr:hypothetical protein [Rickettsiales bacterium]
MIKSKQIMSVMLVVLLSACSIPPRLDNRDLTQIGIEFNEKVYEKGARGYIVLSAYNNIPSSVVVDSYVTFDNEHGDSFSIRLFNGVPKSIMLPPGKYTVTNYYLYGFKSMGNAYTTAGMDDLQKSFDISFEVKAGEFAYLGELSVMAVKTGPTESKLFSGSSQTNYGVNVLAVDKSDKISDNQKSLYSMQSGKPFSTRLANVKKKD